jgi:hypothetical protein
MFYFLKAYVTNDGADIRVLLNHETPWACDTSSESSVSEVILDRTALKDAINNYLQTESTGDVSFVKHIDKAYDTYRAKDGTVVSSFGGNGFIYFCSGHLHKPNEFGMGRGFVDALYIFGEEEDFSYG